MAIFKYTVANQEGKKLSGSIEAPSETMARDELNSLGFSILGLREETPETTQPKEPAKTPDQESHAKFIFESINVQGQPITGTISSTDELSAYKRLTTEYALTVTSIWENGASEETISNAKARGTFHLQQGMESEKESEKIEEEKLSQDQRKKSIFVKTKIEEVLKQVNELIIEHEQVVTPEQKKKIDAKIDKLLRIKNSTNTEYIIQTTEDLLATVQELEVELKKKGHIEKRAQLKLKVKKLLVGLHDTGKSKSLSEDIVKNIQEWQQTHVQKTAKLPWYTRAISSVLLKIEKTFRTPEEVALIKMQIKTYNNQIKEYIKIYFKEPTKDYKEKAKQAIKTILKTRKKAVQNLKDTKARLKQERRKTTAEGGEIKSDFASKLSSELTEFTGWLLAFYLVYYFVSLYITSKNFGFNDPSSLPKSLNFYSTQIFKYVLVIIFLLHSALTVKENFFKHVRLASIIIFPITTFAIIFVLINF